jgi:hypothetical protein
LLLLLLFGAVFFSFASSVEGYGASGDARRQYVGVVT